MGVLFGTMALQPPPGGGGGDDDMWGDLEKVILSMTAFDDDDH